MTIGEALLDCNLGIFRDLRYRGWVKLGDAGFGCVMFMEVVLVLGV